MATGAPIADFIVGKCKINYSKGGGWTEKYTFPADIATARPQFEALLNRRARILAAGFVIAFASMRQQTKPRQSVMPRGYRTGPINLFGEAALGNIEVCNDIRNAIEYKFDAMDGRSVNRAFRGVRDSWVADTALTLAVSLIEPTGADPGVIGALGTHVNALKSFLWSVGTYTALMVRTTNDPITGAPRWIPHTFSGTGGRIIGNGVDTRDTGRGWSQHRARRRKALV